MVPPAPTQALAMHRAGRLDDAAPLYEDAVARSPRDRDLLYLAGLCQMERGDLAAGMRHMRALLRLDPRHAPAHHALGKALVLGGDAARGETHLKKALALDAGLADSRLELGNIAMAAGQFLRAERLWRDGIRIDGNDARFWTNLGETLRRQGRDGDAFQAWQRALSLDPDQAEACVNAALYLANRHRGPDAVAMLEAALRRAPKRPELHAALGAVEVHRARFEEGTVALEAALALRPGDTRSAVRLAQAAQHLCDWDRLDALMPAIADDVAAARAGRPCAVTPFQTFGLKLGEADRQAVARAAARVREASVRETRRALGFRRRAEPKARMHLGYLSCDWRNHPNAHVAAGLFAHHDRAAFETTVLSTGPDDGSEFLAEIRAGCDRFVDLAEYDDRGAAQAIHALGIDILIDVQGLTRLARADIPALRPAPVQVLYQAFCGTMGAPWIDYLIVDRTVVPEGSRPFYDEAPVWMPDCYMVGNGAMRIAEPGPGRAEEGLPGDAVVFCSFAGGFKIGRAVFASWMRILDRVPGAVLWLLGERPALTGNLRRAAAAAGIDPARLVFAERRPKAEHLARHRHADLFLDTTHYSGHVSAMDSLFVAVPVLALPGDAFTGRVSASFLKVLGLDGELVCADAGEYESRAVALGNDPAALAALRARLEEAVRTTPLFDTKRWVRNVERGYRAMWDIAAAGEKPRPIALD
jgi:predicted O-linked N-acetylglucosamine transferase (SPINDLY family)